MVARPQVILIVFKGDRRFQISHLPNVKCFFCYCCMVCGLDRGAAGFHT